MKRTRSDNALVRGLTDYLETLQMAGVDAISLAPPDEGKLAPASSDERPKEHEADRLAEQVVDPGAKRPEEDVVVNTADNGGNRPEEHADDRGIALQQLAARVAQCNACAELAAHRTQTVFGVGNPFAELVFLGEAPGGDEDKQGIPFVGRAGKLLTDMIEKGMKLLRDDVYICNILRCRPPGNRNPAPDEAARCRPFLDATLQLIRPKFICCLGAVAATNLLDTQETIGRLRGRVHDYQGVKVVCTYHPAYLLRNPAAKTDAWNDLKLLMREMGLPAP